MQHKKSSKAVKNTQSGNSQTSFFRHVVHREGVQHLRWHIIVQLLEEMAGPNQTVFEILRTGRHKGLVEAFHRGIQDGGLILQGLHTERETIEGLTEKTHAGGQQERVWLRGCNVVSSQQEGTSRKSGLSM